MGQYSDSKDSQSDQFFSALSAQSTNPNTEVSLLEVSLAELVSAFPESERAYIRVFVRCLSGPKRALVVRSKPDDIQAAIWEHDVHAVASSTLGTGCRINLPTPMGGIKLLVSFDPRRDAMTVTNDSNVDDLHLTPRPSLSPPRRLPPKQSVTAEPGAWTLVLPGLGPGSSAEVIDLLLQPRPRHVWLSSSETPDHPGAVSKRPRAQDTISSKRQKAQATSSRLITQVQGPSNPLLRIGDGETAEFTGPKPRDNYWIKRLRHLATTAHSSLFTEKYSLRPGQVVVVKSLRQPNASFAWRNEVRVHEAVSSHPCILRMFGADAHVLSLYLEFVDAPSLGRAPHMDIANMSTCHDAAYTILSDIASALESVHASGMVHNDIKPDNILYHPDRGAVLIDFGMGSLATETVPTGGTPWYLPPEYLISNTRGPPGDMFALGVTMLWVLGKLPVLPEKSAPVWRIRDIHINSLGSQPARAWKQARAWLVQLEDARKSLSHSPESLESLVDGMLITQPQERYTAQRLLRCLQSICPS